MKKFFFIICVLFGSFLVQDLSAQNQVINFPKGKMPLKEALGVVETQSGLSIAYNENLLDLRKTVDTPSGKKLSQLMPILLEGTGTEAQIQGQMILIVKKAVQPKAARIYSGEVVDSDGEPLPGAMDSKMPLSRLVAGRPASRWSCRKISSCSKNRSSWDTAPCSAATSPPRFRPTSRRRKASVRY